MPVINTNLASLNTQRNLQASQADLNTSIQRLSSGLRVNSAKDDAAGLSIATKMDSQIRGMSQAARNTNDGISMVQTADGALANITEALQRMRELAVQGSSDTNDTTALSNMDKEYQALSAEITRIATQTKFNDIAMLDTGAGSKSIQVGANAGETVAVNFTAVATVAGDVKSQANATTALTAIDAKLAVINTNRSELGASQNRLSTTYSNLQSSIENQSAAKSRIMDTDFAAETAKMTRGQILQQAGTAMLAQANQLPNSVMSLLRG